MAEVKNTGTILAQLFACYPNSQATDQTVGMYLRLLKDIPVAELQTVVDQAIAESEFLPTIARLREMHRKLDNIARLTWADAWELVQKEVRRIGSYQAPKFSDPITTRVVATIGWRNICASEQPDTVRAHFRQMYEALSTREEGLEKLLPQSRALAEKKGGLLPIGKLLEFKQ